MAESDQRNAVTSHNHQRPEGGKAHHSQPSIFAANIATIEAYAKAPNFLARMQQSLLASLYRRFIKPILPLRWLVVWLWRSFYLTYIKLVPRLNGRALTRWRRLVPLSKYVEASQLATVKVFDAERVKTPMPVVFPASDSSCLVSPHDDYIFPSVYVAELKNSLISGGTNLVFCQDDVVCHDLYDFARDYTSEELHGRHVIDPHRMRMRLLLTDKMPEKLEEAATFLDATSANYAHWLTEVLPRIACFCAKDQFAEIPIIINDGLHRNVIESLVQIVGMNRKIIALPVGRSIEVNRLYVTSVTGYVPFERRDNKLKNHSHGLFCPSALQLVRNCCSSAANRSLPRLDHKKIYLRRTSVGRNILNASEVEDFFRAEGYAIVEPEKLSFHEQVALFSGANDIAGPSGAALANLIFAPSAVNIHIFIGKFEGTSYWYWQNIACASEKQIMYHFGVIEHSSNGIHSNFAVDTRKISQGTRPKS